MARNSFERGSGSEDARFPIDRHPVRLDEYCEKLGLDNAHLADQLILFEKLLPKYSRETKMVKLHRDGTTIEIARVAKNQLLLSLIDTETRTGVDKMRCSFLLERHHYGPWMIAQRYTEHKYPVSLDPDHRGLNMLYAQAFRIIGTAVVQDVRVHPELVQLQTQLREDRVAAIRAVPSILRRNMRKEIEGAKRRVRTALTIPPAKLDELM